MAQSNDRPPERLLITPDFPPAKGGIQTLLHEVAVRFGGSMIVMTAWQPGCEEFDASQPYKTVRIRFNSPRTWSRMRALLREGAAAVRHNPIRFLHCGHADFAFAAARLAGRHKLPWLLYSYAQEVLALRGGPRAWFHRRYLRRAPGHLTISRYTQSWLERYGVEASRISLIPLGADLARFAPALRCDAVRQRHGLEGKKVLLTVGRLVRRKGHHTVIEALPEIARAIPEAVYVIVGDGARREELGRLAREKGVEDRVVFAGSVDDIDLPLYYSACDLFVMPASADEASGDVEGFGLVFLEASACGKAVVGGNSGGVPDAVVDGKTGVLVDPNNASLLARVVIDLLRDDEKRGRMGLAGAQWAREVMNWDATLAAVRQAEQKLLLPAR